MFMRHVPSPSPYIPDKILLSIHRGDPYYYVTVSKGVHLSLFTADLEEAKKLAVVRAKLEGYL